MALSLSCGLDPEVPLQDIARWGETGSWKLYKSLFRAEKVRNVELNIQVDHVHIIVSIPPKLSVSDYVGIVKGRSAIRVLQRYKELKQKPYWGNHFWTKGYCVDTVGLDMEKIRAYVRYQDKKEELLEQRQLGL